MTQSGDPRSEGGYQPTSTSGIPPAELKRPTGGSAIEPPSGTALADLERRVAGLEAFCFQADEPVENSVVQRMVRPRDLTESSNICPACKGQLRVFSTTRFERPAHPTFSYDATCEACQREYVWQFAERRWKAAK